MKHLFPFIGAVATCAWLFTGPAPLHAQEAAPTPRMATGEKAKPILTMDVVNSSTTTSAPGTVIFNGPPGDGRRGAKGLLFKAPQESANSTWAFGYTPGKQTFSVQIIHPFRGGQAIVHLRFDGVGASQPAAWIDVGYGNGDRNFLENTAAAASVFPLQAETEYQVLSRLSQEGVYELFIEGKLIAFGVFARANPLSFEIPEGKRFQGAGRGALSFSGTDFPLQWARGWASLFLGPRDGSTHQCRNIRFYSQTVDASDAVVVPQLPYAVVEARVDSTAELRVTKTGIYWIAKSEKPGKHDGRDDPTYVSGNPWIPTWQRPESKNGPETSEPFPFPLLDPEKLQCRVIHASNGRGGKHTERGSISTQTVNGEFAITIKDGANGAFWYKLAIGQNLDDASFANRGPSTAPAKPAPALATAPVTVATIPPTTTPALALTASDLVKTHRSNLVFVTMEGGAGSGFVAGYGNGTYLITNAHVAAGAKGAVFKTLEGAQVPVGAPAVAVGHDIFLMALKQGGNPIPVMIGVDENAAIGDEIVVLGNAEGAGVINTITGKIVGLGPNLVEVDAPFQPGNSGSPIIHLKTGKVVGVATYAIIRKYDPATKEAVKEPVIRRFGYRLDSVKKWEPVNWQAFNAQAAELESIEKLTSDLVTFLQDLGKDGRVDRGAHANPVIRTRIDQWLDVKSRRLSARDAANADQSLLSFLKVTCQSDITTAQQRITYDYFRRQLTDEQKERAEIAGVFGKIIESLRQER